MENGAWEFSICQNAQKNVYEISLKEFVELKL